MEGAERLGAGDFVTKLHGFLPQLYAGGQSLPSLGSIEEQLESAGWKGVPAEPDPYGYEDWRRVYDLLTARLGAFAFYREVQPYESDPEEMTGSLADDVADIYGDLRRGLSIWERGERTAALWEWRFRFESHWSQHAADALRAVVALTRSSLLNWPSPDGGPPVVATLPQLRELWCKGLLVNGITFALNEAVAICKGPEQGAGGAVISIESIEPEPHYLVELGSGRDVIIAQSALQSCAKHTG